MSTPGLPNDSPTPDITDMGDYYFLFIAIDNYKKNPLNNPVRDANAILSTLLDEYDFFKEKPTPKKYLYKKESSETKWESKEGVDYNPNKGGVWVPVYDHPQVKCLYNEEATSTSITDHIDRLAENQQIYSLLIFFSGHGKNLNSNLLLLTFDDRIDAPSLTNNFTQHSQCQHLLTILDCCNAETAQFGLSGKADGESNSRLIVGSSAHNSFSLDGIKGIGSPFALALEDALLNCNEWFLKLDDNFFKDEVGKSMKNQLDRLNGFTQNIETGSIPGRPSGRFNFRIKRKQVTHPKPKFLQGNFLKDLGYYDQSFEIDNYIKKQDPKKIPFLSLFTFNVNNEDKEEDKLIANKIWQTMFKTNFDEPIKGPDLDALKYDPTKPENTELFKSTKQQFVDYIISISRDGIMSKKIIFLFGKTEYLTINDLQSADAYFLDLITTAYEAVKKEGLTPVENKNHLIIILPLVGTKLYFEFKGQDSFYTHLKKVSELSIDTYLFRQWYQKIKLPYVDSLNNLRLGYLIGSSLLDNDDSNTLEGCIDCVTPDLKSKLKEAHPRDVALVLQKKTINNAGNSTIDLDSDSPLPANQAQTIDLVKAVYTFPFQLP